MLASKINEQEELFKSNLTNSSGLKYKLINTTKLDKYEIHHIRPDFDSYYYKKVTKKDKIVLHYTVGTIRGDLASLTKVDTHMSVSYVVARNGIIYEIFDPKYWSYHLGQGSIGGNAYNSERSIGIELSNYGPLKLVKDNLETIYSEQKYEDKGETKTTKKDIYCKVSETESYDKVNFKGYDYFASFTKEQLDSTKELVSYLCKEFDIPKVILDESKRYKVFPSSNASVVYRGICSHVNFRSSGKWDIGPHFPWTDLISSEVKIEEPKIEEVIVEVKVTKPVEPIQLAKVEEAPAKIISEEIEKEKVPVTEVVKPTLAAETEKVNSNISKYLKIFENIFKYLKFFLNAFSKKKN
jgi:N-acetylmuramoyl-L-alanine amidase